jgi:hypothetical protein
VWKENARQTVSQIVAALRLKNPACEGLMHIVSDLIKEVGRQNLLRITEPGESSETRNRLVAETLIELEDLQSALAANDVPKAMERAQAALRLLA